MTIRFSELMAQRGEEPTSVLHELAAGEFEEDSQESLHESPFDDGSRQQMNGEGLTETNGYNPSDDEVRGDLGPTLDQIELPLETSVNEGQKESWSGMLETKAASKTFQFANTMDAILEDDRKLKSITSRLDDQIFDATMRLERNFKRKMPWDMMPHKQKMGCASLDHLFQLPMVGRFDRAVLCSGGADQVVAREDWTVAMPFESKRLFAAKMALSDDELLCGALRKLRNIILFEPRDSQRHLAQATAVLCHPRQCERLHLHSSQSSCIVDISLVCHDMTTLHIRSWKTVRSNLRFYLLITYRPFVSNGCRRRTTRTSRRKNLHHQGRV